MENLEDTKVDSKFRFILLAARRAEQVMRGARPKLQYRTTKVARGAMDEILADAVAWDYGPAPVPQPEVTEAPAETPSPEVVEGGEKS
jgi:DNA-directed RNA polymerase subunit omega